MSLLTRSLEFLQSIEVDQRQDKKFRQGFLGATAGTERSKNKQKIPLLASSPRGVCACSLYAVRVCPAIWLGRGLGILTTPQVVVYARNMNCTLLLLQYFHRWQLSFLVSYYLLSRNCPNCACMQLFLVPYSFLIVCCPRRGVSRCRHCNTAAKVSILSQYQNASWSKVK